MSLISRKYHCQNFIDYNDLLNDGFFDPGRAKSQKEAFSLPNTPFELKNQPILKRSGREILLFDSKNDKILKKIVDEAEQLFKDITDKSFLNPDKKAMILARYINSLFTTNYTITKSKLDFNKYSSVSNSVILPDSVNLSNDITEAKVDLNGIVYIGDFIKNRNGVCRHRVLTFKYLADELNKRLGEPFLWIKVFRGVYYDLSSKKPKAELHCWNVIRWNESEWLHDISISPDSFIELKKRQDYTDLGYHRIKSIIPDPSEGLNLQDKGKYELGGAGNSLDVPLAVLQTEMQGLVSELYWTPSRKDSFALQKEFNSLIKNSKLNDNINIKDNIDLEKDNEYLNLICNNIDFSKNPRGVSGIKNSNYCLYEDESRKTISNSIVLKYPVSEMELLIYKTVSSNSNSNSNLEKFLYEYRFPNTNIGILVKKYEKIKINSDSLHENDIIRMALDIANAINQCHSCKPISILHGNISPQSFLIEQDSRKIILGGFSQSRFIDRDTKKSRSYGVDIPIAFAAPEVLMDEKINLSSDIYSFGITLWSLCNNLDINPYKNLGPFAVGIQVVQNEKRPEFSQKSLDKYPLIVNLAKLCWKTDEKERPCIDKVIGLLLNVSKEYN